MLGGDSGLGLENCPGCSSFKQLPWPLFACGSRLHHLGGSSVSITLLGQIRSRHVENCFPWKSSSFWTAYLKGVEKHLKRFPNIWSFSHKLFIAGSRSLAILFFLFQKNLSRLLITCIHSCQLYVLIIISPPLFQISINLSISPFLSLSLFP